MIVFWTTAALMMACAAGFALWPLFRGRSEGRAARVRAHSNLAIFEDRLAELDADLAEGRVDAEDHEALRGELERSLLGDVTDDEALTEAEPDTVASAAQRRGGGALLWAGAVATPVLALVLYADWGLSLGYLGELALAEDVRVVEQLPVGERDAEQVEALMARLERRLTANPDNADGWFLLGQTALDQGEYERAARAFGQVTAMFPAEVGPHIYHAQALYLAEGRRLAPRVRQAVDRVLELEPGQPIMLELLAMAAFQTGNFAEAADLFQRVLASGVPPGERRDFLRDGLGRALELAGESGMALPPLLPEPAEAPSGDGIRVEVRMPESLLAELPSSAVVFVIARAVGGSPMPLAVQRVRPAESLALHLTVSDAMAPEMSLDSVGEVEVVARLSRAGTAERGAGDMERISGPVATSGAAPVSLWLGAGEPPAAPGAAPEPLAAGPEIHGMNQGGSLDGSNGGIRALVELGPGQRLPEGATVYVFAREVGGPPAPLAVARHRASELPLLVSLDDSMAMTPERRLSSVAAVQIVARVSADGGVVANPGDLEGVSSSLDPNATNRVVNVLIDRVIGN